MKYIGKDIELLIPQRIPFVMVDEFEEVELPASEERITGASCTTSLFVRRDNYFILTDGEISESGLIEHIAQSASALAGYEAVRHDAQRPPVGMIAEVRRFVCHRRPRAGELITTTVTFGFSLGSMTLCHGISCIADDIVCEVDLKIYIK